MSCSNSSTPQEEADSQPVIDQQTFTEILAEVQLAESLGTVLRVEQPLYKDSIANYTLGILQSYGYTFEDFYYSLEAYTADPALLDQIYSDALNILKDRELALGEIEMPKMNINALSRQQLGDLILETPLVALINSDSSLSNVNLVKDSLFSYLQNNPDFYKDKGYNKESIEFTFIINTCNKIMYEQLREYVRTKGDKSLGFD